MNNQKDQARSKSAIALRQWRMATSALALASLAGCTAFPVLQSGPIMTGGPQTPDTGIHHVPAPSGKPEASKIELLSRPLGAPADQASTPPIPASSAEINALVPEREVEVAFVPQSVAQFIDTVFGEILRVPYYTGPGVAQRREFVTLRGPEKISSRQLFIMAQMALEQYGLVVQISDGTVRIVSDIAASGQTPTFIRTRNSPDIPPASRPVIQFFPVSSLDVQALLTLLNEIYPNRGSVRFTAQPETNTLMIMGMSSDVAAAAATVEQIDRPRFAGGQIARIRPTYMTTDQLAQSLSQVLTTEGYQVSNTAEGRQRAIALLPLRFANQLLVFAADPQAFDRAVYWAGELDKASALGDADGTFVYTVQNTSAEELGALVAQVSPAPGAPPGQLPPELAVRRTNGVPAAGPGGTAPATPSTIGNLTIDPAGNRILFRGAPSEYEHIRALLEQLDTPPRQVLVELTIAEVTLTDDTRFGVEWLLDQTIANGTLSATTRGSSDRPSDGLGITATKIFSRGVVEAALTAFAENRNLNILSTPRLVTRSGSEAQILVGTDVPIITSQRAANVQTGGDTDVLQTVQYRQTGVILNVRPIVYGDNRIDIALYQEVSSQQPNDTAAISSPLILNRSVSTQLSLQEGKTAVIGGLIQDSYARNQRGVPVLKDLPLVGAAFRNDSVNGDKVELLILVTPYIIRDADDMTDIAGKLSRSVNDTLRVRGVQVYTLYPWRAPFSTDRDHGAGSLRTPAASTVGEEGQDGAEAGGAVTILAPPAELTRHASTAPALPASADVDEAISHTVVRPESGAASVGLTSPTVMASANAPGLESVVAPAAQTAVQPSPSPVGAPGANTASPRQTKSAPHKKGAKTSTRAKKAR